MLNTLRFFDVTDNLDLPWIEEFKDSDLVVPRVGEYVYLGDDGPWKVKSVYHGYGAERHQQADDCGSGDSEPHRRDHSRDQGYADEAKGFDTIRRSRQR